MFPSANLYYSLFIQCSKTITFYKLIFFFYKFFITLFLVVFVRIKYKWNVCRHCVLRLIIWEWVIYKRWYGTPTWLLFYVQTTEYRVEKKYVVFDNKTRQKKLKKKINSMDNINGRKSINTFLCTLVVMFLRC